MEFNNQHIRDMHMDDLYELLRILNEIESLRNLNLTGSTVDVKVEVLDNYYTREFSSAIANGYEVDNLRQQLEGRYMTNVYNRLDVCNDELVAALNNIIKGKNDVPRT